jgi:hypothetical protein
VNAKELKQLVAHLEELREPRLNVFRELRESIIPHRGVFPNDTEEYRAKLTATLSTYNNAPLQSLRRGASGLWSAMTPPGLPWWSLGFGDASMSSMCLDEVPGAREWLDAVIQAIGAEIRRSGSYQSIHAANEEYIGYGCMLLYAGMEDVQDAEGVYEQRILCSYAPCGSYALSLDTLGSLQAVARNIRYTLKELAEKYGKARLSKASREALEKTPYKNVDVVHVVMRREGRQPGKEDSRNMPVASYFYETDGDDLLHEGGYREMPYFFTTWTSGVTLYGHGPGDVALGEIRTLNSMERDILIGLKKSVDPPMLVPSGHRKTFSTKPGARIEVSATQGEAVRPAQEINFLPGLQAVNAKVQEVAARVDDILLGRVFADPFLDQLQQNVTATAILAQRQQRAQIAGPAVSSYETRILIPLIMRFKSLLDDVGMLPPLPPALARMQKMPRALLKVEFDSPHAQNMRQDEVQKTRAFLEGAAAVIQLDPQARDKINMDQVIDELARNIGAPGSIVRSDQEVEEIRQARAEEMRRQEAQAQAKELADMALKAGSVKTKDTVVGALGGQEATDAPAQ